MATETKTFKTNLTMPKEKTTELTGCLTAENLKNPKLDKIRTDVVDLIQKMFDSGVWHTEALAEIYQLLEDYSDAKSESYKKGLVEKIEKEKIKSFPSVEEGKVIILSDGVKEGLNKAISIINNETK